DDAYGGSIENRARFLLELVTAVRAPTAPDFIIGGRPSGDPLGGGGLGVDEGQEGAPPPARPGKKGYPDLAGASTGTTQGQCDDDTRALLPDGAVPRLREGGTRGCANPRDLRRARGHAGPSGSAHLRGRRRSRRADARHHQRSRISGESAGGPRRRHPTL